MKTRAEIFKELTEKAADTYRRKNADYGDSFVKVRNKFPDSVLVRLNDKLNRLEVLMGKKKKAEVKDESIEDTLLDLANYALMELTERLYEKQAVASDAAAKTAETAPDAHTPVYEQNPLKSFFEQIWYVIRYKCGELFRRRKTK